MMSRLIWTSIFFEWIHKYHESKRYFRIVQLKYVIKPGRCPRRLTKMVHSTHKSTFSSHNNLSKILLTQTEPKSFTSVIYYLRDIELKRHSSLITHFVQTFVFWLSNFLRAKPMMNKDGCHFLYINFQWGNFETFTMYFKTNSPVPKTLQKYFLSVRYI